MKGDRNDCRRISLGRRADVRHLAALARAVANIKAGTPIVVRSEKDGSRAVMTA
jgi:hypothetical protein